MSVEKSFKSFCNKLGGSLHKQELEGLDSYFCQLTNPVKVDGILFGRKADQGKYKLFLVHFGRKKVLELPESEIDEFEVRVDNIEPQFVQGIFSESDQYVTYATKSDVNLYGIEMMYEKKEKSCEINFITG